MAVQSWETIELGQSGDLVEFLQVSSGVAVRKTSRTNPGRLEAQCRKQESFVDVPGLGIPQVTGGWNGSCFEMEYVAGASLGTFLRTASFLELQNCVAGICDVMAHLVGLSDRTDETLANGGGLSEKLDEFRVRQDPKYAAYVLPAIQALEEGARHMSMLRGPNHGDFSFENVIIEANSAKIWLIDFLPSPLETPLIDLGRLLIDAEHGWWKSGVRRTASEVVAWRLLAEGLRRVADRFEIGSTEISFFKTLAALRILPYTLGPVRRSILLDVLDREHRNQKMGFTS